MTTKTFDILGIDMLSISGKPATIQTLIDAVWDDAVHEFEPREPGDDLCCVCWICQTLVPALQQIDEAQP